MANATLQHGMHTRENETINGTAKAGTQPPYHAIGVTYSAIQNSRLSFAGSWAANWVTAPPTLNQTQAASMQASMARTGWLSKIQMFVPSSLTSFHHRKPTSKRPVTFCAGQNRERKCCNDNADNRPRFTAYLHRPEVSSQQNHKQNKGHDEAGDEPTAEDVKDYRNGLPTHTQTVGAHENGETAALQGDSVYGSLTLKATWKKAAMGCELCVMKFPSLPSKSAVNAGCCAMAKLLGFRVSIRAFARKLNVGRTCTKPPRRGFGVQAVHPTAQIPRKQWATVALVLLRT